MADLSEHSGSLSWEFSGFKLRTFLSSKNGDEFVSSQFNAGAFKFQCKMYPNGRKKEQKGCVMLYFVLQTSLSDSKISKITVNARLYCPQTLCDWRHIQHLKKDNAGVGWHTKNMLLSEIQNMNYIKFICEITIVRIEYKNNCINNNNIYHKLTKMNIYSKHEWIINWKTFESFLTAHNGKFYHSNDYNNGCWCSSIAPNGSNTKDINNVKCGLQLLQLPFGLSRIKAKFSIFCPIFDIKITGKKEFNYNSTFISWSDGTLNTSKLLNLNINSNNNNIKLSFIVEIIILKAYDEFDKEIPKTNWFKYGLINNFNSPKQTNNNSNSNTTKMDSETESVYNLLSPYASTTQMSVLSPMNVQNSDGSDTLQMDIKELKEANEEEEEESLEYDNNNSINIFNIKNSLNSSNKTRSTATATHSYSKDISANLELINSQKSVITELTEKLEEIEIYKTEDEKHLIAMEKSMIDLQKQNNRIQQQQFDQTTIIKQYMNDLSLTVQRLTNEIVFIRNKLNNLEMTVENQQIQIFENISNTGHTNTCISNNRNSHSNSSKSSTKSDRKQAKKSNSQSIISKKNKNKSKREYVISSALASWIKHECGLPQYVNKFAENGYDSFEIVKEMSKFELNEIGIILKGHQFKIMKEIEKLNITQKHHRTIGGTDGINHLKMINYLTPVASPAASDSNDMQIIHNNPILTPTNDKSTYSHSKLILNNLNSKTITATGTITATATNTNTHTNTGVREEKIYDINTGKSHKHSSSYGGRHLKQITPIHLTFGSNTLSPSHSQSQSMSMTSYTTQSTTTNNTYAWNTNKKPILLESPTNFSGHNNNHNYNIGYPYQPKLYDSRSIKKGYHNQILPQISDK